MVIKKQTIKLKKVQKNSKPSFEKNKKITKKPVVKTKATVDNKGSEVTKKTEEKKPSKKFSKDLAPLRGMKDILPKDEQFWKAAHHEAEDIAHAYNFGWIETPILEEVSLFIRSIGKGTDVVDKEMYVFEDRDGSKVGLRPEATASLVRSYITNGMQSESQPVKVWTCGPMFRHDRPQAGRFRQFHQFNCESFGVKDASVDAELIVVAYNFLNDLGISSTVFINSIGSKEDRDNYTIELVAYLRSKRSYLCDDCKKRMNKNPLRSLDCKVEQCQPVIEDAPKIIDWLGVESKKYFMKVLEYLDELEVPYMLQPTLVRGLDYYTDTVFEIYEDQDKADTQKSSQGALGGGGRYDLLIGQLGGQPTPASGFAIGLERVVMALKNLKEKGKNIPIVEKRSKIFFAQLGDQARMRALGLIEKLRREGVLVYHNIGKSSLKGQLELANKYGVTHSLILGQKEVLDGTIIIRDMDSGIQEIVDQQKIKQELKKNKLITIKSE